MVNHQALTVITHPLLAIVKVLTTAHQPIMGNLTADHSTVEDMVEDTVGDIVLVVGQLVKLQLTLQILPLTI